MAVDAAWQPMAGAVWRPCSFGRQCYPALRRGRNRHRTAEPAAEEDLRLAFRSAALAAIVAVNVVAVLVVGLLPGTLADSPAETASAPADASALQIALGPVAMDALATPTPDPSPSAIPDPTATPTATPSPSPTPPPTRKPTPKPRLRPRATPLPDTVAGARQYVKNAIGIAQYNCIDYIFTRESKWNPLAGTTTGAYGIPQAFPGSKMAAFGSNWRTSPITQVKWGIWYVDSRYGSACQALTFWQAHGWY